MTLPRIRSAFETRLAAWAAARVPPLPVVWQNTGAAMPQGEHLRAYLLPAGTVALDLAGESRSYRGVFQVSVFARSNTGAGAAERIAQELADLFPPALRMTSGGMTGASLSVMVASPMSAHPAIQEPDWLSVPVDCRYAAVETQP